MLTPVETFLESYPVPFKPRADQIDAVNYLATWDKGKLFAEVGTGKTFMSTAVAFYKVMEGQAEQIIILCPPILLRQWQRWISSFPGVTSLIYRGTVAQRKKMSFGYDVIISTLGLFKNDFSRFLTYFKDRKLVMIIDEAVTVRNPDTLNFRAVRDFSMLGDKHLLLLTGTPINKPLNSYGYIKLCTPEVYRDFNYFKAVHVARDKWGKLALDPYGSPLGYVNLELLAENLMLGCVRICADDVLDMPETTYDPFHYELAPKHQQLYNKLVEELLVTLDDGELLDGTTQQRLYMQTQRLILNPALYGGEQILPAGFQIIDNMLEESDGEKLMIFANFQASNEAIFAHVEKLGGYNPVIVYGVNGPKKNADAMDKFLTDPTCLVAVCNPQSAGVGLNCQEVCRQLLFLELPVTAAGFTQAVGRVRRDGQHRNVLIRIAVALDTIQVRLQKTVVRHEDEVQQVLPSKETLRKALMGVIK